MTITQLNKKELKKWSSWLAAGHGIRALSGHVIYRCEMEYTMYLTPVRTLPGLCVRDQRYNDGLLACFDIAPGIRTIAHAWGDNLPYPSGIVTSARRADLEEELLSLAAAGSVWWGTESLEDPPLMTSILYVFARNFPFSCEGRKELKESAPPPQILHTDLDLI